jgi:preprotein translocase subunit SecE
MGISRPAWLDRVIAWPQHIRKVLHEVRTEMTHVTWPPPSDVRSTTLIVIVTIFFFGAFFFIVDMGVSKVVELILKHGRS